MRLPDGATEGGMTFRLSKEDRKTARDAFNELLNAPDDDKHAIVAVLTVTSLLLHRKKAREDARTVTKQERPHVN